MLRVLTLDRVLFELSEQDLARGRRIRIWDSGISNVRFGFAGHLTEDVDGFGGCFDVEAFVSRLQVS